MLNKEENKNIGFYFGHTIPKHDYKGNPNDTEENILFYKELQNRLVKEITPEMEEWETVKLYRKLQKEAKKSESQVTKIGMQLCHLVWNK